MTIDHDGADNAASARAGAAAPPPWLALNQVAIIQASSECEDFPIAGPIQIPHRVEWRAGVPGPQLVRVRFFAPYHLHRMRIVFREAERTRTQELIIRVWVTGAHRPMDLLRCEIAFTPPAVTCNATDREFSVRDVVAIDLDILPDIDGGSAVATLCELRVA